MEKKRWEILEHIVDTALTLPGEKRSEFIERECGDDADLKSSVTELLTSIEASEGYLEGPNHLLTELFTDFAAEGEPGSSLIGQQIGRYKLVELIGYGGMGSIFLAERVDGTFDQKVALKLIRRGMDTPSNIARFKREQRILANLNHPNIAQIYDGGITKEKLPYLVMEYVDGTPIDQYCSDKNLSIPERIKLFKKVCKAVEHAHKNLVIHRDLKPQNILVTAHGDVKILDFGIAKLLEADASNTSFETQTGARLLTLGYAAPEQLTNKNVTVSADIYALGVLLYKLLTDTHPFDLADKDVLEIEQIIRDERAEKPSKRGHSPKILKGDLDAIVLKLMRKEASARYNSAGELFDDLERYESGLPVLAHEGKSAYRIKKFAKRHKQALFSVAVFLLSIAGITGYYSLQLTQERNQAQIEAQKAQEIAGFLTDLFESNDPNVSQGEELTAKDLLDRGLERVENIESPKIHANMLIVIGEAYQNLGFSDQAREIFDQAIAANQSIYGEESPELAEAYYLRGLTAGLSYDLALPYFRKAYHIRNNFGDKDQELVNVTNKLAVAMRYINKLDSAEYFARKSIKLHDQGNNQSNNTTLRSSKGTLAFVLRKQGKLHEAEKLYLEIIEELETEGSENTLLISGYYNNLGFLYRELNAYEKAINYYQKSLTINEDIRGPGHPTTRIVRHNLASVYEVTGDFEQVEKLMKENVEFTRAKFTTNHWRTARDLGNLGVFYTENQQSEKGEPFLVEYLQIYQQTLGKEHIWTAIAASELAANLYFQDKVSQADSLFDQSISILNEEAADMRSLNVNQIEKVIELYNTSNRPFTEQKKTYQEILSVAGK